MTKSYPCLYCGQFVLFADSNVTLEGKTICPKCLKKRFPAAHRLLDAYNRRTHSLDPIVIDIVPSTKKRPPTHSE